LEREFGEVGLTAPQAAVVVNLIAHDSSSSELGERLSIDSAGITRLVDRLVDKGLVARVPSSTDRRVKRVALTSRGRELAPGLPARYESVANRLASALPAEDLSSLRTMLEAIAAAQPA
jgi:DNA-binding MarR family transcriptional regulator